MLTGGFKTAAQAVAAVADGVTDVVGLARALIIAPDLPNRWQMTGEDVNFPRFSNPPEGGVTAWYTQALTRIAQDQPLDPAADLAKALADYSDRDAARVPLWNAQFPKG